MWLAFITAWVAKSERARSVLSSKVRQYDIRGCTRIRPLTGTPGYIDRHEPAQLPDSRDQIRASFYALPYNCAHDILKIQEPRKAEAPQLRDECRSYRILANCRESRRLEFTPPDSDNTAFNQPVYPKSITLAKKVFIIFS
jgi:hypothetical protein